MSDSKARVHAALERNQRRLWALCYRMTGARQEADDLAQEAAVRAIERAGQATGDDAVGWLLCLTTHLCIDHLRHEKVERRVNQLVDPLVGSDWRLGERVPESAALLREDVRFAVVVALQQLSPRQRAVLILHDVCDRSLEEVAEALGTTANAAKAALHRARVALAAARVHDDCDVPVDRQVVERFAEAIELGSLEKLTALLAADVWGVVDGGGVVPTATKPSFGARAVSRQWANAKKQLGVDVSAPLVIVNAEPAILIRVASSPELVVAVVHLETRDGLVRSLRIQRDPSRVAFVAAAYP